MGKPTTTTGLQSPTVIWQPYKDGYGQEPALLVHRDATGLLVITQEDRDILIQPETLPELIKQLKRLTAEGCEKRGDSDNIEKA